MHWLAFGLLCFIAAKTYFSHLAVLKQKHVPAVIGGNGDTFNIFVLVHFRAVGRYSPSWLALQSLISYVFTL